MLERNGKKDTFRDLLTQVSGSPMGVKFEVEEAEAATAVVDAPAPAPATRPVVRREVQPSRRTEDAQPSIPAANVATANVIRVTPELIESLRNSEPMIKAVMDELGADIVKVEAPEQPATSN